MPLCGAAAEWGVAAGEGEFGIVHKAAFHGTLVAAKILKGSSAIALGDFRSEIEVLRKVHHPNAVQFLGACTKQEPYILVTGAERLSCTHIRFTSPHSLQFHDKAVMNVAARPLARAWHTVGRCYQACQ